MNRLMTEAAVPLSNVHRDATRSRILDAARAVLAEEGVAAFSVPKVSRRSGVSLATIYRHFDSKEALVDAASLLGFDLRDVFAATPATLDGLSDALRNLWQRLDTQRPLVRLQHASEDATVVRRRRASSWVGTLDEALEREGVDASSPEGQRLRALCLLLGGSSGFLELVDRQALPLDEAVAAAEWAVRALVAATAADAHGPRPTSTSTTSRRKRR